MANLPNTDLSISLVASTIGSPARSVAGLIGLAREGGKNHKENSSKKWAFETLEVGADSSEQAKNGKLINGASPYWNIWSGNSPIDWYIDESDGNKFKPVLKRTPLSFGGYVRNVLFNQECYCYLLGCFRGYNHNARPPLIARTKATPVSITIRVEFGDIDWFGAIKRVYNVLDEGTLFFHIGNGWANIPYVKYENKVVDITFNPLSMPPTESQPTPESYIIASIGMYMYNRSLDKYLKICTIPIGEAGDKGIKGYFKNIYTALGTTYEPSVSGIVFIDSKGVQHTGISNPISGNTIWQWWLENSTYSLQRQDTNNGGVQSEAIFRWNNVDYNISIFIQIYVTVGTYKSYEIRFGFPSDLQPSSVPPTLLKIYGYNIVQL